MRAMVYQFSAGSGDEWLGGAGGRAVEETADYCSREGALKLKEQIEAYWRERGHHVLIALHNVGFHPAIRAARYDVRSDMVNGFPRGASSAGRQRPPADIAFVDDYDLADEDLAFE